MLTQPTVPGSRLTSEQRHDVLGGTPTLAAIATKLKRGEFRKVRFTPIHAISTPIHADSRHFNADSRRFTHAVLMQGGGPLRSRGERLFRNS